MSFSDLTYQTKTLQLDRVQAMLPIGLQMVELQQYEDVVYRQLVHTLSACVLSEHLADDTQTERREVPATWRDHALDALQGWAGRQRSAIDAAPVYWLLRRRPIKTRTLEVTVTWHRAATRPHSTLQVDRLGPVVYQERVDKSARWLDD